MKTTLGLVVFVYVVYIKHLCKICINCNIKYNPSQLNVMFHEVNHVIQANNVIIVHSMSVFNSNFLKIRIYEINLLLQISNVYTTVCLPTPRSNETNSSC